MKSCSKCTRLGAEGVRINCTGRLGMKLLELNGTDMVESNTLGERCGLR